MAIGLLFAVLTGLAWVITGAIVGLAERRGCVYMDLFNALSDGEGWLPEPDASDGIHFTGEKYAAWAEFLRTYPYASEPDFEG